MTSHQTPRRRMMAAALLVAAGTIAAGALGAAAPANAQVDPFVAISYSEETHSWGTGWNYTDLDSARIRSLSECQDNGGNHCEFIARAKNGCAALAVNGNYFYGWYGATAAEAQQGALRRNGGGYIAVTQCAT